MTEKVVKRGYVKWTDEDGVFHKEPLADHPEMLTKAEPVEQLRAEEARRLNASAEEQVEEAKETRDEDFKETLAALKKAPDEVHTAAELVGNAPASAAEEPATSTPEERKQAETINEPLIETSHERALRELREETGGE